MGLPQQEPGCVLEGRSRTDNEKGQKLTKENLSIKISLALPAAWETVGHLASLLVST